MGFKFEQLDVWRLSLDYADRIYELSGKLPRDEDFNLKSQIRRAATSVSLNLAEGSAGLTDAEQSRFLSIALRSLIETVACLHLIHRRGYLPDRTVLRQVYIDAEMLFKRLKAFQHSIDPKAVREPGPDYDIGSHMPF